MFGINGSNVFIEIGVVEADDIISRVFFRIGRRPPELGGSRRREDCHLQFDDMPVLFYPVILQHAIFNRPDRPRLQFHFSKGFLQKGHIVVESFVACHFSCQRVRRFPAFGLIFGTDDRISFGFGCYFFRGRQISPVTQNFLADGGFLGRFTHRGCVF